MYLTFFNKLDKNTNDREGVKTLSRMFTERKWYYGGIGIRTAQGTEL